MYDTQAAISWWTWMLHVTMVLIGSYLIVNLTLAVIFINFTKHYSSAKTTASLSRGEGESIALIILWPLYHSFYPPILCVFALAPPLLRRLHSGKLRTKPRQSRTHFH